MRVDGREIAGVDGTCFELAGDRPPGSSRFQPGEVYELCLGDEGELLFYSMGVGELTIEVVAMDVDHDVSREEIEIPYEVVDEDE